MDWKNCVATMLPLESLWDDNGPIVAIRERRLDQVEVESAIRSKSNRLVIVDAGLKPRWILPDQLTEVWNREIKNNVAPGQPFCLDDFPGSYCFVACLWRTIEGASIIVLEKFH